MPKILDIFCILKIFGVYETHLPHFIYTISRAFGNRQETGYVDLHCIKDFAVEGVWSNKPYFNSDAIWQTSDGTLQVPDANSNLWVDINTNIETGLVSGYSNTPIIIHDLNYNLEVTTRITYDGDNNPIYNTPQISLIGGANTDLDITGDLNINLNKSDTYWTPSTLNITVGGDLVGGGGANNEKGNTYHVYGDMNVANNASGTDMHPLGLVLQIRSGFTSQNESPWNTLAIQRNCTFQIDGNLTFSQTPGYTSQDDLNAQLISFKTGIENFIVGGVVDMTSHYSSSGNHEYLVEWNLRTKLGTKHSTFDGSTMFDSNITIGGLKGTALLSATEDYDAANHKINMTFTNKVDAAWQGTFKNDGGTQFHLKMDSSATNTQTMIFSDKSATNSATGLLVDTVSVSGGTLLFQNQSTFGNGELVLDGGKFGALGNGVSFASAVFKSGGLLIGNKDSFSDGIYALNLGALSKEGTEKIGIDFDGFDASLLIGEPAYTLIFCESLSGFSDDANADFIAQNLLGAMASFAWDGNMLTVSFSQVPEPAAMAAIIGALALFVAAQRRKK